MNCLIIDDNKKSVLALQMLLHKNGFVNVFISIDPDIANHILDKKNIHALFVRIKFWHYRLLNSFNSERPPVVVFLSAQREKYKEDLYAQVDYHLCEPYTAIKIENLINRLKAQRITADLNFIFIKNERRYQKLYLEEIEMIECKIGNCIVVHAVKERYVLFGSSLNAFMKKLPENLFMRISDGLIIPKRDTCKIKGNTFFYNGSEKKLTYKQAGRSHLKIMQP